MFRQSRLFSVVLLSAGVCVAATPATAPSLELANSSEMRDWPRVKTLIGDHADVNAAQVDGTTALHWAAQHDDAESTRLLLAAGANAKAANRYGVTPLSLACTNGNAEIVRMLLKAGADANSALHGDETVLMTASRTGKVDAVRALLDAGAKVDAQDRKGQTALMWAAADGNAAVVEALIKSGADPRARLKSGFTPMLFAARDGRMEVVRVLLKAGIDANEPIQPSGRGAAAPAPRVGASPLILAMENGHFEVAAELLKAGANANDDRSGFTPLHVLTWVRKPDRGDGPDGAPPPTGTGNITSLQFGKVLVDGGANVNAQLARGSGGPGKLNMAGATPFLMASKTADLAYMKLLVELGADPKLPTRTGDTPLIATAGLGTIAAGEVAGTDAEVCAALEYLLSLGADINVIDQNGETAMHGAAYKNLPKTIKLLGDKGAKIEVWNKKNRYGWTPLMIAQGFRPGNFKPSAETIEAIEQLMKAAGVTPPPAPSRSTTMPENYDVAEPGV